MKKIIFILCTLCFTVSVLAAHDFEVDGIYYNILEGNTVEVTSGYPNYRDAVIIPNTVTYNDITYTVASIGRWAFDDCMFLTSITIPSSVTTIEQCAIMHCSKLISIIVESGNTIYDSRDNCNAIIETATNTLIASCKNTTITNSVTSIGDYAFYYCSGLTSITIPNSITVIGNYAFADCYSLTSANIGNSVTSLGNRVFSGCDNLTSIIIPNSVTTIGNYTFQDCSSLTSITIGNNITSIGYDSFTGCTSLKTVVWNAKNYADISNNSSSPFYDARGTITSFKIGDSVEYIPAYLCYGMTSLSSLVIPNNVISIGNYAFEGCSALASVEIGNNLTSIGNYAFRNCSAIKTILWNAKNYADIPVSPNPPFYDSRESITSFIFGDAVEYIPHNLCYKMTNLTSITISENVTSIGYYAFQGCSSITSVVWNAKNCADVSQSLFKNSRNTVTSFTFGNNVERIPAEICYYMKNLTSVIIPNSVKSIGNSAFFYCSNLSSANIGNGVINIENSAFSNCFALTSITIGSNVSSIGKDAFSGCSALKTIVWNAKNCADFSSGVNSPFYNSRNTITSFTFGNSVENIPAYVCYEMAKLTSVTIPNSVINIGKWAFGGCAFTSFTIPNSVISIGKCAFTWCDYLKSVSIGNSVEDIGESAFFGCENLSSPITIPNSVTNIGSGAFEYCKSLTSISIGSNVENIGEDAFFSCDALNTVVWNVKKYSDFTDQYESPFYTSLHTNPITTFTFGNSVEHIPAYLCYEMEKLTTVTIGSNVTSMGEHVFSKCTNIEKVVWNAKNIPDFSDSEAAPFYDSQSTITSFTFGGSVEYIPAYLCYDMSELTSVTIGDGVSSIGGSAFYNCYSLNYLKLGNTIKTIGDYAFAYCNSLATLTIPNSVKSIEYAAFQGCSSLTSITVPSGNIASYAFSYCSDLTSVSIGSGVTNIGSEAFGYCDDLASIRVANSNAYYDSRENCNAIIETATNTLIAGCYNTIIPYGVTAIGEYAFSACDNLTSIEIPNSVTTIGNMAFSGCSNLTSITIPNSVRSIGSRAFYRCLTEIYVKATTPPEIVDNTFSTSPICYVPCGTIDAYSTTNWITSCSEIIEEQLYQIYLTAAPHDYGTVKVVSRPDCENAIISATPNEGYNFVIWSDGNTQATRHIALNQEVSLKAYFAQKGYTIHVYQDCTVTVE